MPITVLEDECGALTIERRLPFGMRLLFGGVFAGFALVILYTIGMGIVSYFRYAMLRELLENARGFVVMFLGFLLFAVPAWIFLFRRAGIVVAAGAGIISDYSEYRLFRRERSYRIDQVASVNVSYHVSQTKGGSSACYPVVLVMKDEKVVTVSREEDEGPSRKLARQLSKRLGVPFRDLI